MPVVTMPDGATVNLPDNPTPEERLQIQQLAAGGQQSQLRDNVLETGRVIDTGTRKGLAGLPGLIGDTGLAVMRNAREVPPTMGILGIPGMVDRFFDPKAESPVHSTKFGDVTTALETAGGTVPLNKPETRTGRSAANILESIVGAVSGGGPAKAAQRAVIGAGAGVGGDIGERVAGENPNPIAKIIGALLGGSATAIGTMFRPNASEIIQTATEKMTPKDWARGRTEAALLEANKIPHLKSQVLGPRSTMPDAVQIAGGNPSVKPTLMTHVEGTPAAAKDAFTRWSDTNLSPGLGLQNRSEVLDDIQGIAQKAIDELKKEANKKFREAMPPEGLTYTPEKVTAFRNELIAMAKSSRYGETSSAGKALLKFADDLLVPSKGPDLSGVNPTLLLRARQQGIDPATLPGAKKSTTVITDAHKVNNLLKEMKLKSQSEDYAGLPISDILAKGRKYTMEFEPARKAKTAFMDSTVNPAQKGLLGQIAQAGGGQQYDKLTARDQILKMVFRDDQAQPRAIKELSAQIGPDNLASLLREHLARSMEKATKLTAGNTDLQSPHRFVASITTFDPKGAQRQNIEAAINEIAISQGRNPKAVKAGFYDLLNSFDSTKNLRIPDSIDKAALQQEAGRSVAGILVAPHSRAGRLFWETASTRTMEKIAEIVTSPNGLEIMETLAKTPQPERKRALAIGVLMQARQAADQSEQKGN